MAKTKKQTKSKTEKNSTKTSEGQNGKKNKDRQKEKDAGIKQELMDIYGDNGAMPDMSKLEKIKKSKWSKILLITFIFLLVLSVATWVGFLIFGGLNKFSGTGVKLEIEAPSDISSGGEVTYTINYANKEKLPISRVEIVATYPQGFVFGESVPEPINENKNIWSLGTLTPGQKGEIKISGLLFGNIDSQQNFNAVINYRPANFNSDFRETAILSSNITSSVIDLDLEHDEQLVAGEEAVLNLKYKNNKDTQIDQARLTILLPENFTPAEDGFVPEPSDDEDNIWVLENLRPEEEDSIKISGSFSDDVQGEKELTATLEIKADDEWKIQQEKTFILEILKGELLVNLIANGETEGRPINFGDTLNYSFVYQNKGDTEVKNLVITAKYEGDILDWEAVEEDIDGEIKDNAIVWTADEIRDLRVVEPGEEGTIDWQIKVKDKTDFDKNEEMPGALEVIMLVEIGEVGESGAGSLIETEAMVHELNSDLSLESEGRYFNDDNIALGTGPLPPEVGKTTSYRIFWNIENSVHEVTDVVIKTILPEDVFWTGKSVVSAGQLNFNVNTREIIWSINRIPKTVRQLDANFEVSITPDENDTGNVITLAPETVLEATDKVTGDKINLASGPITTNLENDPYTDGGGMVR